MTTDGEPTDPADPLALGQTAAAQLGGDWQLDVVEELADDLGEAAPPQEEYAAHEDSGGSCPPLAAEEAGTSRPRPAEDVPPSAEQLVEAMLFVGGATLTADAACGAVRGLTPEGFAEAVGRLNARYRDQRRPYSVEARADGFVLAVRPAYRPLRERLFGGPREARLAQPALDVLSVVAYRQPLGKAEVDAVRGTDSGAVLRQLVRLGLIAVTHRADATGREVRYGTTSRFLQVFGLAALDELPRLGDAQQV